MPKKYELIHPPVVEAEEVTIDNMKDVAKWCQGWTTLSLFVGIDVVVSRGKQIRRAFIGWYIVKSGAGDFSVMEPDAFKAKYRLQETINGE